MRRRKGAMRLEDLDAEQRAAVQAKLDEGGAGQSFASALRRAHGPAPKRTDGYRSKAEADYAAWLGGISGTRSSYERVRVAVEAAGCHYTPDFNVNVSHWSSDFPPECIAAGWFFVDVKGTSKGKPFYRNGDRRRLLDGAAALHRETGRPLYVAWKVKNAWHHELVKVRP